MNKCDAQHTMNFIDLRIRYLLKLKMEHSCYRLTANVGSLHI